MTYQNCPNKRWDPSVGDAVSRGGLSSQERPGHNYVRTKRTPSYSNRGGDRPPAQNPAYPDYPGDDLPDDSPFRKLPEGPYPGQPKYPYRHTPNPYAPGIPYRPVLPKPKPGGGASPLNVPRGPKILGGLTRKGFRLLKGINPLGRLLNALLDWPLWVEPGPVYPWDLPGMGFTNIKTCQPVGGPQFISGVAYSGPDTRRRNSTSDPNLSCATTGQIPDGLMSTATAFTLARWVSFGPHNQGGITRMQIRYQWYRPNQGLVPLKDTRLPPGVISPPITPLVPPAIDPFIIPPNIPMLPPAPIPYGVIPHRRHNPRRDPREQPGGEQPTRALPRRAPGGGTRLPAIEIVIHPGGGTGTPPKGGGGSPPKVDPPHKGTHVRRPPAPREREKKSIMALSNTGFLGFVIGAIGEGADMLGILWDSLPKSVRKQFRWKDSTILDRGSFILEHINDISWGHVIANAAANQLEDAGFGRLGGMGAKAHQNAHRTTGLDVSGRLPKPYLQELPYLKDKWLQAFDDWLSKNMGEF